MKNYIKHILKRIKRTFPKVRFFWNIARFFIGKSSLHQIGWFKSAWRLSSVNKEGDPIPWLTYSAVHFLENQDFSGLEVFEYGSGNSTIWWSKKAGKVISVEYDQAWYKRVKKELPSNTEVIYQELNKDYPAAIKRNDNKYHIVVVDGRMRVDCAKLAADYLYEGGIIIWDNTERARYQSGINFLKKRGFKQIEFFGAAPIDNKVAYTSVFYQDNNVLNI